MYYVTFKTARTRVNVKKHGGGYESILLLWLAIGERTHQRRLCRPTVGRDRGLPPSPAITNEIVGQTSLVNAELPLFGL